jgi:cell division protein FtsB
MLLRTRLRRLGVPLALYAVSGAVSAYFVWHAVNGQRGLKTSLDYGRQIAELQADLDRLNGERQRWSRKIALVKGEAIDRDVLEEQSRILLGRSHKYDLVVLNPQRPR